MAGEMIGITLIVILLRETSGSISVSMTKADETIGAAGGCIDLGTSEKLAHVGWPFHFTCDDIISPAKKDDPEIYKKYRRRAAEVTSFNTNGTIAWKYSGTTVDLRYGSFPYPTFNVFANTTAPFHMKYKIPDIGYCSMITYRLKPEELPNNSTCNHTEMAANTWYGAFGDMFTFLCQVPHDVYPKIYANPDDLQYEWWYNCTKSFPDNVIITKDRLTVTDISYSNGGGYTCAVKYNGQTRFLQKEDFCVRARTSGTYSIKCANHTDAREGEDLNVTCIVDFDEDYMFYYDFTMAWFKDNLGKSLQEVCSSIPRRGVVNSSTDGERIQCENLMIMPDVSCFRFQPSPTQEKSAHVFFQLKLMIKNIRPTDAGRYILEFHVFGDDSAFTSVDINVSSGQGQNLASPSKGHRLGQKGLPRQR